MPQSGNPVCPACGEGVGSTSTYCMHCDAEFDVPATAEHADGAATNGGTTVESTTPASTTPDTVDDYGTTGDGYDGDHPLDGAARVLGLALAALVGLAGTVTVVLAFAQQASIWLPLAVLALAGTAGLGVYVWRVPTGRGALSRSLYVTAAGLVVVTVTFGLLVGTDGTFGGRILLAVVSGGFGFLFAVPSALVGYWLSPDRV